VENSAAAESTKTAKKEFASLTAIFDRTLRKSVGRQRDACPPYNFHAQKKPDGEPSGFFRQLA
jgi:hypothetical protein